MKMPIMFLLSVLCFIVGFGIGFLIVWALIRVASRYDEYMERLLKAMDKECKRCDEEKCDK